ncbi:amino acid transporter [Zopfia rhizophila CBS 207.26]|uniref:Amino acid transporter n=1 Tax=Zopfia rhizophila CBS 207.26 TaxID=1314779 RepID=A0A6A6E195_9PEZI|nr:amino acid transporter [Zopfia rhizophila CBS 207.26]
MADKDLGIDTIVTDYHGRENGNQNKSERDDFRSGSSSNVFERYINLVAIVNFGFTLQAGWETVGLTFQFALFNGGPASLVYGCILAGIGSTAIATSLGEMASMDPTVGAQYRWSARFAQKWPEFWGLMQGWITVFAWIVNVGGSLSVLSNMVQGLVIFHNETYEPKRWHATMFMWAFIVAPVLCNLFLRRVLNTLETIGGICHVLFFIVVIATLSTLADRSTPEFVFQTLTTDVSGWSNPGVAWSLGLLTTVFPITSFDGVLHMIDETKEPRKRVPKSMFLSVTLNAIMQLGFCICLLFCIGDFEKVSASQLPLVEVYYGATKSKAGATIMVLMHGIIFLVSLFNIFASVSRLVWAFARDKGLPFHNFFTYVHPTLQIPLPALFLVGFICGLLSLINIGSTVAFTALVSLPTIALYISYFIPIFLLMLRKLAGKHPQYGPWRLGKWGLPINLFSLCYIVFVLIWIPFPPSRPVTAASMNYAGPLVLAVIAFALLDWFTTGKKRFTVPTGAIVIEMEDEVGGKRSPSSDA